MGIFDTIKNAIFRRGEQAAKPSAGTATAAPKAAPTSTGGASPSGGQAAPPSGKGNGAAASQPQPSAAPAMSEVDVEAVLEAMAAKNPQKLNWRTSIVDLMKLLDLDSSLANRKELAKELGYTGDMNDSASMNIWLHKQVMKKLAESGGKVPESLRA
nr:MAG: hypothetical protein DIU56_16050 [Pseudomonadota bacterium]